MIRENKVEYEVIIFWKFIEVGHDFKVLKIMTIMIIDKALYDNNINSSTAGWSKNLSKSMKVRSRLKKNDSIGVHRDTTIQY